MNRFDVYAKIYDRILKNLRFSYKEELIIEKLNPKSNEKILDIGGGTGYMASKISEMVEKIVVLDVSKKMLDYAKKYKGLEICVAKAQNIPFPNGFFDSVICVDALHHIKEFDKAISEMARVLKKDGKIIICEFEIKGLKGFIFWLFEKIIDNSKFIKSGELSAKMEKYGFSGKMTKISDLEYLYTGKNT